METKIEDIASVLARDVEWFEKISVASLSLYFQSNEQLLSIYELEPPAIEQDVSSYGQFILEHMLGFEERLVLILSLIPYLKPQSLDIFMTKNNTLNTEYTEFGGVKDTSKNGFYPSLETACFILTGNDLSRRLAFLDKINEQHFFFKKEILKLDPEKDFNPEQKLQLTKEYLHLFTRGDALHPLYSARFPAMEIQTMLGWEDLVVEESVQHDLNEILEWLLHSKKILQDWNLNKMLKPGYRTLFYGPPGTGKTLAATLLGKACQKPVFRIDLSMVVSKYIGETEKNLGRLFDEAANKEWILFFDEADALFGKRTQTKGANDRYANQEVAYLLQRIEDFPGLVILATNLQTNIDEAFSRRFQSTIYFPKPKSKERKRLWKKLLFEYFSIDDLEKLENEIEKYELSGGEMINVVRYCAIQAAKRDEKKINLADVITGIKREYTKTNKTL